MDAVEEAVEERVGVVKRFFPRVSAAAIELTEGALSVGDTIHIKGHTTDFEDQVARIEVDHEAVEQAEPGALVGVRVRGRVREHDVVYRKTQRQTQA